MTPSPGRTLLPSGRVADLAAAGLLLALAAFGVFVGDVYHDVDSGHSVYTLLLGMFVALAALAGAMRRWQATRLAVAAAVCTWIWYALLQGNVAGPKLGDQVLRPWHIALLALPLTWLSLAIPPDIWARLRLALLAGATLFVASPPFLAAARAEDRHWPVRSAAPQAHAGAARQATLFVLLDELNSNAIAGIVGDLQQAGLQVQSKAVASVGSATAKTIPAMWTGLNFDEAKSCGFTTICSGSNALDFSRVTASFANIDVVGMYHPYCAMQGLRYCSRSAFSLGLFDATRWSCGLRHMLRQATKGSECTDLARAAWGAFIARVEAALWAAPIWQQGGFLYAHLPYPHPPGGSAEGTLRQDYSANVERARATVKGMIGRLQATGIRDIRIVIFSDHPLRIQYWCGTNTYQGRCADAEAHRDALTPLIVGSTSGAVDLDRMQTNGQVFELVEATAR